MLIIEVRGYEIACRQSLITRTGVLSIPGTWFLAMFLKINLRFNLSKVIE